MIVPFASALDLRHRDYHGVTAISRGTGMLDEGVGLKSSVVMTVKVRVAVGAFAVSEEWCQGPFNR